MNDVGTSYLFWLACLLQLHGLHRLYNGKVGTGLLWLCTFGLFGVGQFLDLVFIPSMVNEHNLKVRNRLDSSPTGVPINSVTWVEPRRKPHAAPVVAPKGDRPMLQLLKAAQARGGKISVTQGVLDTEMGFVEVETTLREMVKSGYVAVENHPETGVILYHFIEL